MYIKKQRSQPHNAFDFGAGAESWKPGSRAPRCSSGIVRVVSPSAMVANTVSSAGGFSYTPRGASDTYHPIPIKL